MEAIACDVLVIGSGAAGLTTAITAHHFGADVLVVEKASTFGGTTARSGGWLWVPGNPLASRSGVDDPLEDARPTSSTRRETTSTKRASTAFLENAGAMIDFLEANSEVKFNFGKNYPDYHPDHPGGAEEGRSIHPLPFDGRKLGSNLATLAQPMRELTFMGMGLNSGPDLKHFLNATRSLTSAIFVASRILAHGRDVIVHGRGIRLVNGNALAARLLKTALDPDTAVAVVAGCQSRERKRPRCGCDRREEARPFASTRAAGSFLRPAAFRTMRTARGVTSNICKPAPPMLAYARGQHGRRASAWPKTSTRRSTTAFPMPRPGCRCRSSRERTAASGGSFHLIDRAKPGVIAVTRDGRRFTNESENYHDFVCAMIDACAGGEEVSAFMICDHRTIRRYGLGAVRPSPLPIFPYVRSGYLKTGRSSGNWHIGRHRPENLERTIEEVNRDAAAGTRSRLQPGGNVLSASSRRRAFCAEPLHRRDIRRTVLCG